MNGMNGIDQIIALTEAFGAARGIQDATVSTMVFADGKRVQAIRNGRDVGVLTTVKAVQWFSDHWPDNAEWPADIARPERTDALEVVRAS